MVIWLVPFELHHLVALRNWAGENWFVRHFEHRHNKFLGVSAHAAAVHSTHFILVDFGGFQILSGIGVDSEVSDLFEFSIRA
jgi:hypothetical protein